MKSVNMKRRSRRKTPPANHHDSNSRGRTQAVGSLGIVSGGMERGAHTKSRLDTMEAVPVDDSNNLPETSVKREPDKEFAPPGTARRRIEARIEKLIKNLKMFRENGQLFTDRLPINMPVEATLQNSYINPGSFEIEVYDQQRESIRNTAQAVMGRVTEMDLKIRRLEADCRAENATVIAKTKELDSMHAQHLSAIESLGAEHLKILTALDESESMLRAESARRLNLEESLQSVQASAVDLACKMADAESRRQQVNEKAEAIRRISCSIEEAFIQSERHFSQMIESALHIEKTLRYERSLRAFAEKQMTLINEKLSEIKPYSEPFAFTPLTSQMTGKELQRQGPDNFMDGSGETATSDTVSSMSSSGDRQKRFVIWSYLMGIIFLSMFITLLLTATFLTHYPFLE